MGSEITFSTWLQCITDVKKQSAIIKNANKTADNNVHMAEFCYATRNKSQGKTKVKSKLSHNSLRARISEVQLSSNHKNGQIAMEKECGLQQAHSGRRPVEALQGTSAKP